MGEAERSIAIKRKTAVSVIKPTSREDSPSEVYTPKRRKSETGVAEVSPPPYIPSRKEPSTPRLRSSTQDKERYRLGSSKQDARQLLERREHSKMTLPTTSTPKDRQELISRSRHIELFQKLGIDRTELFSERERRTKEKEKEVTVKSERDKPEVRNFRITARIAPSSRSSESVKDRLTRAIEGRERSLQVTLRPSMSSQRATSSMASRLGKVVVQRSSSSDCKKVERVSEDKHKTQVNLSRGRRLALSRLGKEVVKRQCEAAVLSVKSVAARIQDQFKVEDSRVVESHTSSDEDESVQEKPPTESVILLKESGKSEQDGGRDKDSEDLDDMLNDDLEPDLLNDSHKDEFTLDLEDDEDLIKVVGQLENEDVSTEREKSSSSGTRFIVTLDGVDGRHFEGHQDNAIIPASPSTAPLSVPNLQVSEVSKPVDQATFLLPQDPSCSVPVLKAAPPKIQPFSISLKDSDDEVEDKSDPKAYSNVAAYSHPVVPTVDRIPISEPTDMTTLQKAKQSERCKFWPACAAGSECEFHHPTSYCKTFPNCKFGDKCLFIHPNCKFDSKCTRVDCPFTHTSRRPVLAAPASQKPPPYYPQYIPFSNGPQTTVCKFYPNCHNVNCPFVHPKPCRFGVSCQSAGCPFLHPSLPSKDKLKWTAQADQQQSAKDGVGLTATTTTLLAQPSFAKPPLSSNSSPAGSSAVSSTSV